MATTHRSHGEPHSSELSASSLRPVARWTTVVSETGRPRLEMSWSVPDVTPAVAIGRHESTPSTTLR